jgi:sialic acid synthase SpsE
MNIKTEIIAEIAQGYEGKKKLLNQLVNEAISLDVDGIKFQLVYADELATRDYKYYKLFKSLQMPISDWMKISKKIRNKKKLYFDIFGEKSLKIAKKLKADGVKLSTTEFYNENLIIKSLKCFKKVILSVGGLPIKEIKKLEKKILNKYKKKIILIYGFQSEPTEIFQNNFLKLKALMYEFKNYKFAFMDHSHGGKKEALYTSLLALGNGVIMIEKHFTLDRKKKIEDYISGLSKNKFKKFINIIRFYESSLGDTSFKLNEQERLYAKKALKVVVAKKNLKKGKILTNQDLVLKRVGSNSLYLVNIIKNIVGKKINRDVIIDQPILKKYVK